MLWKDSPLAGAEAVLLRVTEPFSRASLARTMCRASSAVSRSSVKSIRSFGVPTLLAA